MGKTLFDIVTKHGEEELFGLPPADVYGLPATEELIGRTALLPDGTEVSFGECLTASSDGTESFCGDMLAVKCADDLFLTFLDGHFYLVEELPDESLKALDILKEIAGKKALPEELEGWETELSFAPGEVLTAVFKDGTLTLSPAPEPVIGNPFGLAAPKDNDGEASGETASGGAASRELSFGGLASEMPAPGVLPLEALKTGEKRFLLRFPETNEIVFLDGQRFLLYALLDGRIVCGFVEVPGVE